MAAALDSDHFGAWYKLAVPLFFVRFGPVPIAPYEQNRNFDVGIVLRCQLPTLCVS
jgi:hypothetical protein